MTSKRALEDLVDDLVLKIGFKISDNNFTKNLIYYLNSKHELGSDNLNGGISLVSEEMFKATQNRNNKDFLNYYEAIKSEIGLSWNEVTYDELGSSSANAIIASMLNIQAAFYDDKLLPGMAYDEQCTFYLKLIQNEQYFGNTEKENCEAKWPITGNSSGRDFYDVTSSIKTFAIPLPLLSEENSYFGIKIRLDPAEGAWVGFSDNCRYSTVYKKANREIKAIYRLEDYDGNFQQPTEKRKIKICIRFEHSDPEEDFSQLYLTEYDWLPAEEQWDDDGPQFKSLFPRSGESINPEEGLNIKNSYEAVKGELMIEEAIKIDSYYEISDWGSFTNNDEQIFGENRGLTIMATWSIVGGLLGFLLIIIIIFLVHRCCKTSENDPMKLPSGTRNSYAAGNSKSTESDPQDTLPPPPAGWMRRSIRNLSKIVQKTPPTQRKLPAGYNMSDFA